MKRTLALLILAPLLFSACHPARFFYHPNNVLYADPDKLELNYEMLSFPSANGKKIFALFFPAEETPRGTIVHFHGNFGNVSNHFPALHWVTRRGYDYLVFDYQGFGGSEGKPTPKRTIEDGRAAIQFALDHARDPEKNIFVVGQSLGGAVASVAVSKEPKVKALVLEAAFTSYRSIARDVLGRAWILWPLYPIYPLFLGKKWDPIKWVDQISPRPILFIHGTEDRVIPIEMSKKLYEKAKDPKELWVVEGAGHMTVRPKNQREYEDRIIQFFENAIERKGSGVAPAKAGAQ